MKIIVITFFMLLYSSSNLIEFSYKDSCNNIIVIEKTESLPKPLSVKFFQENLNSKILDSKFCNDEDNFQINITDVKRISKNKYDLRIFAMPNSDSINIQKLLKYRGYTHYLLKIKKEKSECKIEKVERRFGEI
jgi:hypothetical protein